MDTTQTHAHKWADQPAGYCQNCGAGQDRCTECGHTTRCDCPSLYIQAGDPAWVLTLPEYAAELVNGGAA